MDDKPLLCTACVHCDYSTLLGVYVCRRKIVARQSHTDPVDGKAIHESTGSLLICADERKKPWLFMIPACGPKALFFKAQEPK